MITLGLDIGSNSVGSSWFDDGTGSLVTATSIFPAGVEESDDKRGDPKNVKRRNTRHTRVNLARRAEETSSPPQPDFQRFVASNG